MQENSLKAMYSESSTEELLAELKETVDMYAKFNLDGDFVPHTIFGMHEETVYYRDTIHRCIEELLGRGVSVDTDIVKNLDTQWQQHILQHKEPGFTLVDLNRENEPHSHWWFWIDQLDTLTEEEKATL